MTQRGADTLSWDGWGRHRGGSFNGTTVSYAFDAAGFRRSRTTLGGGRTISGRYLLGGLFEANGIGAITIADIDGAAGDLAHYAGPPTTSSTATFLYYNGHGDLVSVCLDYSGRSIRPSDEIHANSPERQYPLKRSRSSRSHSAAVTSTAFLSSQGVWSTRTGLLSDPQR